MGFRKYNEYTPDERVEKRKLTIIEALLDGPKTFAELYKMLGKKEPKVRRGWSKSDFSRYLKELQDEFFIGKNSDKKYTLVQDVLGMRDFEIFKSMHNTYKKREKELSEILEKISRATVPRKDMFMTVNDYIFEYLIRYLISVEATVRAPRKFRSYARWLLERLTDHFCQILIALGKKDGAATDFVLWGTEEILYNQINARLD